MKSVQYFKSKAMDKVVGIILVVVVMIYDDQIFERKLLFSCTHL